MERTHVLEQTQHLVVGRVVGQEETEIGGAENGSDADQASAASGHDGDILPSVFALLALAVHDVVEVGDGLAQRLDASGRAVLATSHGDLDGLGALEAAGNVIFDLRGSLTKVGPGIGVLGEAVLVGALCAPDHTRRRSAGVEAGMGHMAFMGIAELAMDLGLDLCRKYDISIFSSLKSSQLFFFWSVHGLYAG